jgi:hypothetical protein
MARYVEIIEATDPMMAPPRWAILERHAIDLMNQAVDPLLQRYVYPDGSIMWPTSDAHTGVDALDDAYESFHNWPLFYLLGGGDHIRDLAEKEFDAITRQFARYDSGRGHPMVVKEYEQGYDWFHQGEGYLFFYLLGLANPDNAKNAARAARFAGFYLNEDPDAPNYDANLRLVRCPHVGSKGPGYRYSEGRPAPAWGYADWKRYYGLPFQDVPGCDSLDSVLNRDVALRMGQVVQERMSRGDVAMNLAITSMVTNAYLHTGENKYRQWVLDYVEAWMDRTRQNNGILPDNVGLSGKIGEYTGGKWYGGHYGWTWPHGWHSIGAGLLAAAENATLLTGDLSYMEFARSQVELLMRNGITLDDGTLYVPQKYGDNGWFGYSHYLRDVLLEDGTRSVPSDKPTKPLLWKDGWFEFQPMSPSYVTHIWATSLLPEDMARVMRLRDYVKRDWDRIIPTGGKDQGGHEQAWLSYLKGEYPSYPEEILEYNIGQVYNRLHYMQHDKQDPSTYGDWYLQARNPITAEGLTQLTMGAPLPVYNGGLLITPVRYYDAERKRPGLPQDVAALVPHVEESGLVVQLVNLSGNEYRDVILQAGAFGEHEFTQVRYEVRAADAPAGRYYDASTEIPTVEKTREIGAPSFQVHLRPGSQITLQIGMRRFVNDPSCRQPWQ